MADDKGMDWLKKPCTHCGTQNDISDDVCAGCQTPLLDEEAAAVDDLGEMVTEWMEHLGEDAAEIEKILVEAKEEAAARSETGTAPDITSEDDMEDDDRIEVYEENEMEKAHRQVESARASVEKALTLGLDTMDAEVLLSEAQTACERGEYRAALDTALKCTGQIEDKLLQHKILMEAIKSARETIARSHQAGGDVAEAIELLKRARGAMDVGDLPGALDFALKSSEAAEKSRGYTSWRVDISDWM